jgi:tRNA(Ile)-lysidine synthase
MPPQPKPRRVADPDQLARLEADLARLTGHKPSEVRFGVAVSGGPDSVALLLMMRQLKLGALEAATVDHGLRAESAGEAAVVADLCSALGVPHAILRSQHPLSGSIQAEARTLRYTLLDGWRAARGLAFVVTAHHADDQAETLLMRLNRASGVGGLAGIRARNGHVLRPVLNWRRSDLAEICARAGVMVTDDPSNRDARFDRARIRHEIKDIDWLDPQALARSAELLDAANVALDWAAMQAKTSDAPDSINDEAWPDELAWRVLRDRLGAFAGQTFTDQRQLLNAIAALRGGRKVSLGPVTITPDRKLTTRWRIALAPPRRA